MKTLWTPWRMEHVADAFPKPTGCIFEPPGEAVCDKKSLLLHRDAFVVVLMNRFPYANGHLLVAPRRHVAEISGLTAGEQGALMAMLGFACDTLKETLHAEGVNLGLNLGRCAGAGIPEHLHFQVVPRWENDHNFITVLADLRTIPQHIEETFDALVPAFAAWRAERGCKEKIA